MNLSIEAIELDETTQCRAVMEQDTIDEYAEAMGNGDDFPPIDVFGTKTKCWLGDGWYRVSAAKKLGLTEISATLHSGGRTEAIKFALQANAKHGNRRTNEDKRKAVQVATREFPNLSSRAIAEMCAVSARLVERNRPTAELPQLRIGRDGKKRPASPQKVTDMTGKKIGMLTFTKRVGTAKDSSGGRALWEAKCDCGNITTIDAGRVRSGNTTSCGCKKNNIRAEAQKRKMIEILAYIRGSCRGLPDLKLPLIHSVCSKEEIKDWSNTAKKLSRQLNVFAKNLTKGGGK